MPYYGCVKMDKIGKQNLVSFRICKIDDIDNCPFCDEMRCSKHGKCFIKEKTEEQLDYILSPIDENIYLEACAGSGKTEALGLKAAYELSNWESRDSGIAFLSFTNDAKDTIDDRIKKYCTDKISSKHFIGTFSSFVHQYISQPFGYYQYDKLKSKKDASFTLVDRDTEANSHQWLKQYSVKFPAEHGKEILAHNIVPSHQVKWIVYETPVIDYYQSDYLQKVINKKRKEKGNQYLYAQDYFIKMIEEAKFIFNSDGFANFEDMNFIAVKVLKNNKLCELISKRFPLIFVDECQDLSLVELVLLYYLIKAGTKVHLVGDLNQAIYSFKEAIPERTEKFVNKLFETYRLTNNFRSTQHIVDFSVKLRKSEAIQGTLEGDIPPLYFEYEDECTLVESFESILNNYSIKINNSVVLSRGQSIIDKIKTSKNSLDKHRLIKAIQLWQHDIIEDKKEAMILLAKEITKWLDTPGAVLQYYCPKDYCESVFEWRLALRNILNELCDNPSTNSFSGLTYSEWYRKAKEALLSIFNNELKKCFTINGFDFESIKRKLKAPSGTADRLVDTLTTVSNTEMNIKTVHSAKGETYDAVLFVSGKTKASKESYWKNWFDNETEPNRIAYVACTRPRQLLCWALPKLSEEDKEIINELGMVEYILD